MRSRFILVLLALLLSPFCLSVSNIKKLENQLTTTNGLDQAQTYAELAIKLRQKKPSIAKAYGENALQLLVEFPHKKTKVKSLNAIAWTNLLLGDFEAAGQKANSAKLLALKINDQLAVAFALNTIAAKSWFEGDLPAAKDFFSQSLAIRIAQKSTSEISTSYNNLGNVEQHLGNFTQALENYLKAIHYAELIKDDLLLANAYTNMGVLNQALGNYNKALNYHQKVLAVALKLNNQRDASEAYNNIAAIYEIREEHEKSIKYLKLGLEQLKNIQSPQQKKYLYMGLGTAYMNLNQLNEAYQNFMIAKEYKFDGVQINIPINSYIASVLLAMKKPAEALPYAQTALDLSIESEDAKLTEDSYNTLYLIHKALGMYQKALEAHEKSNNIREEILNTEKNDIIESLQAKFETKQKEKKLISLTQKNKIQSLELERQYFLRNIYILATIIAIIATFIIFRIRTTRLKTIVLEEKVNERTKEIEKQNHTIADLLKHKEYLLQKKNELFSNISHEFRTPLTLIMGPIKRLLKNRKDKSIHETLDPVLFNANRLLRMVDQLLDLARLDLFAEEHSKPINTESTLRFILTSMGSLFDEHQLELNSQIQPNLWIQISDDALEKILVNLLSNAVKYTPERGRVEVKAWQENQQVMISVKDNGVGIPLEEQSIIFNRFVRLNNNHAKTIPGAGVGLAIVKEMVERFDGKITINNDSDKGACFTLTFPLIDEPQSSEEDLNRKLSHNSTSMICEEEINAIKTKSFETAHTTTDFKTIDDKKTILIVEDNSDMRNFIAQGLSEHYHCLMAEDGQIGVRIALQEIPDLIITDLMMPNKSGFELAKVLRDDFNTSHIPIIMLTAKGDKLSRHEAWQLEIDEYFEKPFDDEELLLRCDNLLSIRQLISTKFHDHLINATSETNKNTIRHLVSKRDQDFIQKLEDYLHDNFAKPALNARLICDALYMTDKQLQRKIKALLGQTIPEYVRNYRLRKGAELLKKEHDILTVAMSVGFSSQNYFSKSFSVRYNMSPSEYRAKG